MKDPIVEEVRATRERLAAACGFDLHRIAEAARVWQRESGVVVVSRPPQTPAVFPTPVSGDGKSPAGCLDSSAPAAG